MIAIVRATARLFLTALVLLAATEAVAQTQAQLVYAGFGFSGDYANRSKLYPYSADLADEEDRNYFDRLLRERLAAHPQAAARLNLDQANAALDQNAVAFALAQESVEQQRMDGKYWIILTLHANILAFNKRTNSIVAAYPVRLRLARAHSTPLSPAELKEWVRSAYTSSDPGANVFDLWLDRLATLKPRNGATRYLRLTNVGFTPEATATLVAEHVDVEAMRNQIANAFEASVAEATQISLVPNSVGEAIGNKMACRFADGAEIALTLPDAEFALTFTVRGFASKTLEKPAYFQDIFRVLGAVSLMQPNLNQVYLNENVYQTEIVTRPRNAQVELSTWPQYYKTLQLLMAGVAKAMNREDDTWLAESASRGLEAKPAFLNTNNIITELK